ncbi:hypothetical protein T492DRAFT_1033601 [Pavlovales sp. CCMP2436]|nr:hypothetical protein T492DRAFT_1033601 [Pavlovales sp. CCMP2436]
MLEAVLTIGGMTCGHCEQRVRKALGTLSGVESAEVSLTAATAVVHYTSERVSVAEMIAAVERTGFSAVATRDDDDIESGIVRAEMLPTPDEDPPERPLQREAAAPAVVLSLEREATAAAFELSVLDMRCQRCVCWVSEAVRKLPGVDAVSLSLDTGALTVLAQPDTVSWSSIAAAVVAVGFRVLDAANIPRKLEPRLIMEMLSLAPHPRATVRFSVGGMTCGSCVGRVRKALLAVPGVEEASVSLITNMATALVRADGGAEAALFRTQLLKAVRSAGYEAVESLVQTAALRVEGIACDACPMRIERVLLESTPGVLSARVDRELALVYVDFDPDWCSVRQVRAALRDLGYEADAAAEGLAKSNGAKGKPAIDELRSWFLAFIHSCILVLPCFVLSMACPVLQTSTIEWLSADALTPSSAPARLPRLWLLCWVMVTPVQFGVGSRFYRGAFRALRKCSANMDVLIALGTTIAYFYSVWITLERVVASPVPPEGAAMAMGSGMRICEPWFSTAGNGGNGGGVSLPGVREGGAMPFFETSGILILFVVLGKCLEALAKGRTKNALQLLLKLQPEVATLLVPNSRSAHPLFPAAAVRSSAIVPIGRASADDLCTDPVGKAPTLLSAELLFDEREVPTSSLQIGDLVLVRPGEAVPADGVVESGSTSVDESLVTGESMPRTRRAGDPVIGGSINQAGVVRVRLTADASNGVLQGIVRLVEDAQASRAPIQEYADTISAVFVPVVVLLATLTFAIWLGLGLAATPPEAVTDSLTRAVRISLAVVVIACPCALGLATPTAVMVGTGVGARMGVLIKGGEPLEIAHSVSAIVFDKTGTLTTGDVRVQALRLFEHAAHAMGAAAEADAAALESRTSLHAHQLALRLLGAAESVSEHPIARAVVAYARLELSGAELPLPNAEDAQILIGMGLRCTVEGARVVVGTRELLASEGLPISAAAELTARVLEARAVTVIFFAIIIPGGPPPVCGLVGVADAVKADAKAAVEALSASGIEVWMCSGDNERTARAVGAQVGIATDRVLAGLKPQGKVAHVKALQAAGKVVAMVGDGINDAPALSQADLGIALGAGTDIAIDSAKIVLMRNSLMGVYAALQISKATFKRIKLNFVWAFGFNLVSLPFAAGVLWPLFHVLLPPELAALVMASSSVCVIMSSLLLRNFKPVGMQSVGLVEAPTSEHVPLAIAMAPTADKAALHA